LKNKHISEEQAARLINNGDTVVTVGFMLAGHADAVSKAVEKRFLETGEPKGITMLFGASQSNPTNNTGLNRWCKPGLIKRIIGGHLNLQKDMAALIIENKVEAYNFPQGVIIHLIRAIGGKQPGLVTHIGLQTFADPRLEGGKLNSVTAENLVELVALGGKEYLWYKPQHVNVAIIRGTLADEKGNLTWGKEAMRLEHLQAAMAAKACGGIVIAQVETLCAAGSLPAKDVFVPGMLVDYVVVAKNPEEHPQTAADVYEPWLSAQARIPVSAIAPIPLDERKVICRRAALELLPDAVINLGIGIPEGVGAVASEEGLTEYLTGTVESGAIGGVAQSGLRFGTAINPEAFMNHSDQFDFYNGGGLDLTVLGLAEVDGQGNLNVSKFGPRVAGAGGFINITQSSKKIIFTGTFTASGLKCRIGDGRLTIEQEGKVKKFIKKVSQVTFSADFARENNLEVYFVTERAVFTPGPSGLVLAEIAPGVDLKKDILANMEFEPQIHPGLKVMDERIFTDKPMGLLKGFLQKLHASEE
jgi:propionate CoA-transferase